MDIHIYLIFLCVSLHGVPPPKHGRLTILYLGVQLNGPMNEVSSVVSWNIDLDYMDMNF